MDTSARKTRHLDICLTEDVASRLDAGWSGVRLRHEALPEFALEDVETATTFLGHRFRAGIARHQRLAHRPARSIARRFGGLE